jgi:hypothetical protein
MLAKLIVEGKEFDIEIQDPKLQELLSPTHRTGYERLEYNKKYFAEGCGYLQSYADWGKTQDEAYYKCGNYYSDKTVAENNIRADNLMRQLRRFAVEHRKKEFDWCDSNQGKWSIYYDYVNGPRLETWDMYNSRELGSVYFDSCETAELAVKTFKDELIWYFTEYKDSLRGD